MTERGAGYNSEEEAGAAVGGASHVVIDVVEEAEKVAFALHGGDSHIPESVEDHVGSTELSEEVTHPNGQPYEIVSLEEQSRMISRFFEPTKNQTTTTHEDRWQLKQDELLLEGISKLPRKKREEVYRRWISNKEATTMLSLEAHLRNLDYSVSYWVHEADAFRDMVTKARRQFEEKKNSLHPEDAEMTVRAESSADAATAGARDNDVSKFPDRRATQTKGH